MHWSNAGAGGGLPGRAGPNGGALLRLSGRALLNVGVTGTNGKTTTAFLLRRALEAAGLPCGYLGTLGFWGDGELEKMDNTTPEAVHLHGLLRRLVNAGKRAAVLEVSSHGLH